MDRRSNGEDDEETGEGDRKVGARDNRNYGRGIDANLVAARIPSPSPGHRPGMISAVTTHTNICRIE